MHTPLSRETSATFTTSMLLLLWYSSPEVLPPDTFCFVWILPHRTMFFRMIVTLRKHTLTLSCEAAGFSERLVRSLELKTIHQSLSHAFIPDPQGWRPVSILSGIMSVLLLQKIFYVQIVLKARHANSIASCTDFLNAACCVTNQCTLCPVHKCNKTL